MDVVTLRQKQSKFARMVAALIQHATEIGYEVTLGEAWRSPEECTRQAAAGRGTENSLHRDRLAIDLNLFRDGVYLRSADSHRPLGEFWETLGGTWGGRFGDGNHYSLEHAGRK